MALSPCQVSDLRNQVYPEDGLGPFPGEGRVVGRQKMRKITDRVEETSGKLALGWLGAVQSKLRVASPALTVHAGPRFPMPFLQAPG